MRKLRAIYMGKSKASALAGLRFLTEANVEIACVVAPPGTELERMALGLGLQTCSDQDLYEKPIPGIDLVISFLFWKKIRKPLIEMARLGCINFHPAPLPDFRGLGGYNFAILENLPEWGVSAHFVDEQFDTGDIIAVKKFSIRASEETAHSLEQKSQAQLLDLFQETISSLLRNETLPRTPQSRGRYITRSDFEKARRIDSCDSVEIIERKTRAFWYPPFGGAYIEKDGKEFTLVSKELLQLIANTK